MRFKVDENLHPEVVGLLKQAGHDALSVGEQVYEARTTRISRPSVGVKVVPS